MLRSWPQLNKSWSGWECSLTGRNNNWIHKEILLLSHYNFHEALIIYLLPQESFPWWIQSFFWWVFNPPWIICPLRQDSFVAKYRGRGHLRGRGSQQGWLLAGDGWLKSVCYGRGRGRRCLSQSPSTDLPLDPMLVREQEGWGVWGCGLGEDCRKLRKQLTQVARRKQNGRVLRENVFLLRENISYLCVGRIHKLLGLLGDRWYCLVGGLSGIQQSSWHAVPDSFIHIPIYPFHPSTHSSTHPATHSCILH